jgi:uncharacterized repeat protein (TIGR01451 family)
MANPIDENEKRDAQGRAAVQGALKANKYKKFAKKHGAGNKLQAAAAGAGALRGFSKANKKADKDTEKDLEDGEIKKRTRRGGAAREGTKEAAKAGFKKGVSSTIGNLGPIGRAAALAINFTVDHPKLVLRSAGIILLIIFLCFLIPFFMVMDNELFDQQLGQNDQNKLKITKQGPTTAKAGDQLQYTISVTYPGSATDADVTDQLPDGTTFVCASVGANPCTAKDSSAAYDKASNTVTWDAKKLAIPLENPINFILNITLNATKNNDNVINYASVSLTGGSLATNGGGTTGGTVAPNHDTCGGKYQLTSTLGNFGDPQCNFNPQALGTELNQLDNLHKYTWDCIARYETGGGTGYDPNGYNPGSTSGKGAYGLFQMNPHGQGNGQYDVGDINWQVQTSNAINYNNKVSGGNFTYWGTDSVNGGPCH